MAGQNDPFVRLNQVLGATFKLTQKKRDELMKEFRRTSELQRDQVRAHVEELLTKSKKGADALGKVVRDEVVKQVKALNLLSREDAYALIEKLIDAAMAKSSETFAHTFNGGVTRDKTESENNESEAPKPAPVHKAEGVESEAADEAPKATPSTRTRTSTPRSAAVKPSAAKTSATPKPSAAKTSATPKPRAPRARTTSGEKPAAAPRTRRPAAPKLPSEEG